VTTTEESRGWDPEGRKEHERGNVQGRAEGWLRGWELAAVVNRRKTTGEMSEQ